MDKYLNKKFDKFLNVFMNRLRMEIFDSFFDYKYLVIDGKKIR